LAFFTKLNWARQSWRSLVNWTCCDSNRPRVALYCVDQVTLQKGVGENDVLSPMLLWVVESPGRKIGMLPKGSFGLTGSTTVAPPLGRCRESDQVSDAVSPRPPVGAAASKEENAPGRNRRGPAG
jgi:hypothetical protein